MTISIYDAEILRSEGFTNAEVEAFSMATDPAGNVQPPIEIRSPFWIHLRETRQTLLEDLVQIMQDEGWSERMITREATDEIIDGFYGENRKYKDPWEWLKTEYKPKKKKELII